MDNFYQDSEFRWFLTELRREVAADLNSWAEDNPDELPFNDLFPDGKTRVVVPFNEDPIAISILQKIKHLGFRINPAKSTVVSFGPDKKREIRLGKFLLASDEFTPEEKEWFKTQGHAINSLKEADKVANYAIIASRNPIDIVRMSNHDGWTSCHADNREYFQCAISDAKGAGAIAYVVNRDDLQNVDLDAPEIFTDRQRHVDGIKPISRIRIRKFVHKHDDYDLAVPEDRTYGKTIPGLEDSVLQWSFNGQQDKLEGKRPSMNDFKLMGGSYQDTMSSTLFNNFFGDNEDSGEAEYGGEDDYTNMADQYEEEIDGIDEEYRKKLEHCHSWASVEDDGEQPYVYYGGGIQFELPASRINLGSKMAMWKNHEMRRALGEWARHNDIYSEDMDIEEDGKFVKIRFNVRDDGNPTPDGYRDFIEQTLMPLDEKYDELMSSLYGFLVDSKVADPSKSYDMMQDWDNLPELQNFEWGGENESYLMAYMKEPIEVGEISGSFYDAGIYLRAGMEKLKSTIIQDIESWGQRLAATKQLSLFKEPEFAVPASHPFGKFNIKPDVEFVMSGNKVNMKVAISIGLHDEDEDTEDAVKLIQFLDKNWQRFIVMARQVFNSIMNPRTASVSAQTRTSAPAPATPQ